MFPNFVIETVIHGNMVTEVGRVSCQVLESLQYIDSSGAVQLKGRVACQISSHELLLTELLFENVLSPMAPEESAALLSCLVFTQNTQVEPHITNTLQEVSGRQHRYQRTNGYLSSTEHDVTLFSPPVTHTHTHTHLVLHCADLMCNKTSSLCREDKGTLANSPEAKTLSIIQRSGLPLSGTPLCEYLSRPCPEVCVLGREDETQSGLSNRETFLYQL